MRHEANSIPVDNVELLKNYTFTEDDFQFQEKGEVLSDTVPEDPPVGFFKDAMIRFSKNKASMVSIFMLLFIIIMAIFGPMMGDFHFREQNVQWDRLPPRIPILENFGIFDGTSVVTVQVANMPNWESVYIETVRTFYQTAGARTVPMAEIRIDAYANVGAEDVYFWFGSDMLGRDLWTRLWRGARVSLTMAAIAVLINLTIGVVFGAVAAYYGKKTDMIMLYIMEVFNAVPTLIMVIIIATRLGTTMWSLIIALTFSGWIGMAQMMRAQFYRYKGQEYVMAARVMGASDKRLIFRYILPNAIGPTITQVAVAIPTFMMTEAFLSYLGLGIQAPEPSVGVLLSQGQEMLLTNPHAVFFPALVISILMLSFQMMSNGLRDAFDPTLRGH